MVKRCKRCNKEKSIEEFHKSPGKKDGLHSYCKICAIQNAKEYYKTNRDVVLHKSTEYNRIKKQKIRLVVEEIKKREGCCFLWRNGTLLS